MANVIHAVAAIIINTQGEYLINERPADKSWAGYWEFPGGKIENGENGKQALIRELHEELFLQLNCDDLQHIYNDRRHDIIVDFYCCHLNKLIAPKAMEGQRWLWVQQSEIHLFNFLKSNKVILDKLLSLCHV